MGEWELKNKLYPLYEADSVNNLKELINLAANKYGEYAAFIYERKKETVRISYRRFKSDIEALGTAFFDMGIRNTKIAVIGENSYEWILTYFAAVNGGNVIVPLDKELPLGEIKSLLIHSDTTVLVYSDEYSDVADTLISNRLELSHYINMATDLSALIEKGKTLISEGNTSFIDYHIDNDALATILYTSGTTGSPKGVMLSHKNMAAATVASCKNVYVEGTTLLVLPLHHVYAMTVNILCILHWGAMIAINSGLKNVSSDLVKYKPKTIFLVPLFVETLYKRIWDTAKKSGKDKLLKILIGVSNTFLKIGIDLRKTLFKQVLSAFGGQLEVIVSSGAPLDENLARGFGDFGITVLNGYGLTETSPTISVNRNRHYRYDSVGPVLSDCEVRINEPDENSNGEIWVKGDGVMLGYYKNEQATSEAFDGKWFKTGDIGHVDSNNFLYITGRKKNLILLSNGKNVYPEELEQALHGHIVYIKECVVYAEGDTIVAEVFLDTENEPDCVTRLDGDIAQLNRALPPYKHIEKTVIRDTEFPKTTTKKIKREYSS